MVTGKLKPYEVAIENKRHGKTEKCPYTKRKQGKICTGEKGEEKTQEGRDGIMPDSLPVPHEPSSASCPQVPRHSTVSTWPPPPIVVILICCGILFLEAKSLNFNNLLT